MKADRIASVIFILTALIFWTWTGDLQYNGLIFPRLLIVFLVLLSAIMFGQTFIAREPSKKSVIPKDAKYVITSVAAAGLWIYLLNIAGFVVSSVVILTGLTVMLDLERPTIVKTVSTLAVYVLMVSAFWLIFHKFLLVPLPTGYLI